MTRTARTFLIATVALTLVAAACGTDSGTDDGAAVAAPTPNETAAATAAPPAESPTAEATWPHEFKANLIGGGTIDTGDYVGQDLVLWFWAPW